MPFWGWKRGANRIIEHWFWRLRYLLYTSKCTFTSWLLDSLDLPSGRKNTHRLASRVDYSFNQWSVVSFVIKKYIFMVKQCIYLVILMYFMQINFHFLWSENLQILSYLWIFCWPYKQRELSRKAKFREVSKS